MMTKGLNSEAGLAIFSNVADFDLAAANAANAILADYMNALCGAKSLLDATAGNYPAIVRDNVTLNAIRGARAVLDRAESEMKRQRDIIDTLLRTIGVDLPQIEGVFVDPAAPVMMP